MTNTPANTTMRATVQDRFRRARERPDSEFQTMWLETTVEHHEGAVEMAQEEQDNGQYKPAVDLAGAVVKTQTD